ncbi:MAG: anhydro-N-acetylmuramic acid kinase [Sedimentisphaerales bacterium]
MSRQIQQIANKSKVRVVGLMSGTSADGVDAAVVDIGGRKVQLLAFETFPYPAALRRRILSLCRPESARLDDICNYNFVLGEIFAEAVVRLCSQSGLALSSIDLIGSHGQTIYHNPYGRRYGRAVIRSTLQIGEPSVIAQRTGITTVADFRPRDMAAGGEGAPLVPYADYVLFGHKRLNRAVQNIGGIANVTFLLVGCKQDDLIAFDTGPGNMVIDGVVRLMSGGRRHFDRGGRMAARGAVDESFLSEMLRHPFLRRRPPKSTGREEFGADFAERICRQGTKKGLAEADIVATVTAFTAQSIARAYRRFLPALPDEVILCGGGSHNETLVEMLQNELPEVKMLSTGDFGISVDAKEAVSFAILAWATIKGLTNNVPGATGAEQPVVVDLINAEDTRVPMAVARQREQIAAAIDVIVDRFRQGGRLFYVGAGTSGRLGVLDASECPPTFGVSPSLVQGIIAGGRRALVRSAEGAEDHAEDGAESIRKKRVRSSERIGAATVFVTCAPEAVQHIPAEIIINPVVGPEVVTGSTRMKAGTATKLVLNMLTTGAMIRLGKVYGNLMVDLQATNEKLRDRSVRIVMEMTQLSRPRAMKLLARAQGKVKAALVMHFRRVDLIRALAILKENGEFLRPAISQPEEPA